VVRDPNKHETTMSSSAAAFDSKSREGEPCHPSHPFTPRHVRSASRHCALLQPIAAHTTDSKQRLSECSDECHILCCWVHDADQSRPWSCELGRATERVCEDGTMLFATADMFATQKPPLVDCPVVFLNGACVDVRACVCVCARPNTSTSLGQTRVPTLLAPWPLSGCVRAAVFLRCGGFRTVRVGRARQWRCDVFVGHVQARGCRATDYACSLLLKSRAKENVLWSVLTFARTRTRTLLPQLLGAPAGYFGQDDVDTASNKDDAKERIVLSEKYVGTCLNPHLHTRRAFFFDLLCFPLVSSHMLIKQHAPSVLEPS
jgi:hypothetical protein